MDKRVAERMMRDLGVVQENTHEVLHSSGRHTMVLIRMGMLYSHAKETSELVQALAAKFEGDRPDAVVSPRNAAILSQLMAACLSKAEHKSILAFYAVGTKQGLVIRNGGSIPYVHGKKVLVITGVIDTGESARKLVETVQTDGGNVIGFGALWHRGGPDITAESIRVPKLRVLVSRSFETRHPSACRYPACVTSRSRASAE